MENFFNQMEEQSKIKSLIVSKYFGAWSRIMCNKVDKLGYIDLYSGPGYYENGDKSTPIRILEMCIQNSKLHNKIVTIFNDSNNEIARRLQESINNLPGIELLDNRPKVSNIEVDDETAEQFKSMEMIPCFSFIDPFGYKGISAKLINALVKDWGSDCIFFFNFNRINAAINNPKVESLVNAIFGDNIAKLIRDRVNNLEPTERENLIIEKITRVLSNNSENFVLPFRFISAKRNSTSHYLIFVSKHILGYEIMKDIMCKSSSEHNDGVGSFSYIPTSNIQLNFLYALSRPLDDLKDKLSRKFNGKTLTVRQIYDLDNVNTPYVLKNYKDVLLELEKGKKIIANPSYTERRNYRKKKSMSDKVSITFY